MREKPEPDWPRRLADWTNPEGARKVDSVVDKVSCPSHSFLTTGQMLTIVKAGCGKSARPVWEADGGQHRKVRLLRPDSNEAGEQTLDDRARSRWSQRRRTEGNIGRQHMCRTQSRKPTADEAAEYLSWSPPSGSPHAAYP